MRRTTTALLATALPLSLLAFTPAVDDSVDDSETTPQQDVQAGDVLTPEPIDVTMYLHGDDEVGTVDENAYAGESNGILEMDRVEPTGGYETRAITNYAQGPNARCAGNGLLPVWVGVLGDGTIEGFATMDFRVLGGTGGEAVIDVFTGVSGQACNEAYPEPVASQSFTIPAGEGGVSVQIDLAGVKADTYLMVQVRGADSPNAMDNPVDDPGAPIWPSSIAPTDPTAQGRIVYDGESFLSNISFTCQPDDVVVEEGQTAEDALAGADCLPY